MQMIIRKHTFFWILNLRIKAFIVDELSLVWRVDNMFLTNAPWLLMISSREKILWCRKPMMMCNGRQVLQALFFILNRLHKCDRAPLVRCLPHGYWPWSKHVKTYSFCSRWQKTVKRPLLKYSWKLKGRGIMSSFGKNNNDGFCLEDPVWPSYPGFHTLRRPWAACWIFISSRDFLFLMTDFSDIRNTPKRFESFSSLTDPFVARESSSSSGSFVFGFDIWRWNIDLSTWSGVRRDFDIFLLLRFIHMT